MARLMNNILAPMWHYAAPRVSIKLARLSLAMRKAGYDPYIAKGGARRRWGDSE